MQVYHLAAVRERQALRVNVAAFQHALGPELLHEDRNALLDGHLVVRE
jgi:hypothetical protein